MASLLAVAEGRGGGRMSSLPTTSELEVQAVSGHDVDARPVVPQTLLQGGRLCGGDVLPADLLGERVDGGARRVRRRRHQFPVDEIVVTGAGQGPSKAAALGGDEHVGGLFAESVDVLIAAQGSGLAG